MNSFPKQGVIYRGFGPGNFWIALDHMGYVRANFTLIILCGIPQLTGACERVKKFN